MMYHNVAVIMQPHYKTRCFRVSTNNQISRGEYNYIVVTSTTMWNGMYKYPSKNTAFYKIWSNKGRPCYCVPMDDCVKIKELDDITDGVLLEEIEKQQKKYETMKKNGDFLH